MVVQSEESRGRSPNIWGGGPIIGRHGVFMKKVRLHPEKCKKLKIKERVVFVTGVVLISAIGVAVTS
jgi:hypothetical protein